MALALLWKPSGPGSQDFIRDFKKKVSQPGASTDSRGIGHSGTLDPFAEGLLICGMDEGTKLLAPLSGLDKTYTACLVLGASTGTLDATSEIEFPSENFKSKVEEFVANLSQKRAELESFLKDFLASKLGKFRQTPPQHSAVHVEGKRAYEWAREGIQKKLKDRETEILSARHLGLETELLLGTSVLLWTFEVRVSTGTYIRSLARDWGQELVGFPGHLRTLIRSAVGPFVGDEQLRLKGYKWLGVEDLEPLFKTRRLDVNESESLAKHGRWNSIALETKSLLCSPSGQILAWTEASSGRLGRVFLEDPLTLPFCPSPAELIQKA